MSNNVINKLSRRQTLNLLGVGGLTTAFMVGSHTVAKAQNNIPGFIQEWLDFTNTQDSVAQAAIYTQDGVLDSVPFKQVIQGRDNIQCFFENVHAGLSNISVELLDAFATKNWAVADYNFIATNNGLVSDPSTLNKSFKVRSASIFKLEENKIQYFNEFFDNADILFQLGLISSLPSVPNKCKD